MFQKAAVGERTINFDTSSMAHLGLWLSTLRIQGVMAFQMRTSNRCSIPWKAISECGSGQLSAFNKWRRNEA